MTDPTSGWRPRRRVRDGMLTAARLGTCDDRGFAPFAGDTSTARVMVLAKITAWVRARGWPLGT